MRPTGKGWFLDDPAVGIPIIEQARKMGVKTICAHKGLPLFGFDRAKASPRDIGVVAKAYPDMNFVVYHSGWYPGHARRAVRSEQRRLGVNTLVKSLLDNGVAAEHQRLRRDGLDVAQPDERHDAGRARARQAAEVLSARTTCSGARTASGPARRSRRSSRSARSRSTRSSPQQYGYPALTAEVKRKVFGLNAARLYGVDAESAAT